MQAHGWAGVLYSVLAPTAEMRLRARNFLFKTHPLKTRQLGKPVIQSDSVPPFAYMCAVWSLARRHQSDFFFGVVVTCMLTFAWPSIALTASCKPGHFRPAFFVRTMGRCGFDLENLSFSGKPDEQARCLMRGMDSSRNLAPDLESLPAALANRIGKDIALPSREVLSGFLSKQSGMGFCRLSVAAGFARP